MRRQIAITALLFAWLCVNGAVWDAVQMFAWGRMFVANTALMDVGEALRATFDPANRCHLCENLSEARTTEEQQTPAPSSRADEKLVLARDIPAAIVFVSARQDWPAALASAAPVRIEPVPVPPPRIG